MNFSHSHALQARADKALAGGPATLSKHASRYPAGISPLFLERAQGCSVWDVDGNHYIDTVAALGPIILGHCDPAVTLAVQEQTTEATSLTLSHRLEVEVAELLQPLTPWGINARIRFGKDGMAATNAAVRLARHVTGGDHIIVCGYHGGADFYMCSTDKNGGILSNIAEYTHQVPFGDIEAFERTWNVMWFDCAGMILEIPPQPWGESLEKVSRYLHHVRDRIQEAGGLLIFDEIVTGFRYPFAWNMYGCTPDLLCLGKGIANGYPLSVVAGPNNIMMSFDNGEVFWSTTFGGETIALAAAKATIMQLTTEKRQEQITTYGSAYGTAMLRLIHATFAAPYVTLMGNHARMILRWNDVPGRPPGALLKTLWIAKNIELGVLYGGPIFPMSCWTQDTVQTLLNAAKETFAHIETAIGTGTCETILPCPAITDVFNSRYQETAAPEKETV